MATVVSVIEYDSVFAQASFQFDGHLGEFLIPRTRHLTLLYMQTRFGAGGHRLCRYESGRLVEERRFASSGSLIGYYARWWWTWRRELVRFAQQHLTTIAVFSLPLAAVGCLTLPKVRHVFWQWDYFPGRGIADRLFNAVARHYASRVRRYVPLTRAIGRAMGFPEAPVKMFGLRPPTRFATAASRRLLLVGQLRPGQGVEDVLDFVARHRDYSLALMGAAANGFDAVIRERIASAGMESQVRFGNRFVSPVELAETASTCLAALALYDTAPDNLTHYADPGKVKSAIELGLPVVMTRISEVADYVERYRCGEVIDSIDELPEALAKIRSELPAYREGCRRFAAAFDYERHYSDLLPKP